MHKLENPARIAELSPPETLERLGLLDGISFADIGAGTGIFTTAAAQITCAQIWAIDPSAGMRTIILEKKNDLGLQQVEIVSDVSELPGESVDLALLCTVLHEIDDQEAFLTLIATRLKPEGRLAVIEFHKSASPFGPPPEIRISPEDTVRFAACSQLEERERFTLGDNFYCIVFGRETK